MTMNNPQKPLFLYISPIRLVLLSIVSMGIYEIYWIYRNWQFLKERHKMNIRPIARGIFGIFYCHSLLRRIRDDPEGRAIQAATYSAGWLATGWVILIIISRILVQMPYVWINILAVIVPSFLFLVPVQNYINTMTIKRNPTQAMYGWSFGHIVCLVIGIIFWGVTLLPLVYELA